MRRAYADIPEGQVHYVEEGAGEPVLLLHQTPASWIEYSRVMPLLAQSHRTIAMDTMGFGLSDAPPGVFTIADYARTVAEFLAALGIGRTVLIGHHTGASIALEVAASRPDLISRLVLSGCPYYTAEERPSKIAASHPMQVRADGGHLLEVWGHLQRTSPDAPPEIRHATAVYRMMAGTRGEEAHLAVFNYDEQKRLPLVRCPTLFMVGTKDILYPKLAPASRMVPGSKTRVLEGGTSLDALMMPGEFAGAILDFLGETTRHAGERR